MKIKEHLDKDNLHHAYIIEGSRDDILPEIISFFEEMGVATLANPDFYNISIDSFKIKDAENLKSMGSEKSFSASKNAKKIFIISANNFLLEAQNSLLKIFEEPTPNTHFFIIVPDKDVLLRTVSSRFYFISAKSDQREDLKEAESFIKMSLPARIIFLKELLAVPEDDDEEEGESMNTNSARAKANRFLNALEKVLSKNTRQDLVPAFDQIFKVREYLRQPGSSTKSLMESVALLVPSF